MSGVKEVLQSISAHMLWGGCVGVCVGGVDLLLLGSASSAGLAILGGYADLSFSEALAWVLVASVVWCMLLFSGQAVLMLLWERLRQRSFWLMGITVACFGFCVSAGWYDTALQGDGISAHPLHAWIEGGVWLFLFSGITVTHLWEILQPGMCRWFWLILGLGGVLFSSFFLPLYTEFHAYLLVYSVWCIGIFLWQTRKVQQTRGVQEHMARQSRGRSTLLARPDVTFFGSVLAFSALLVCGYQLCTSKAGVLQIQEDLTLGRYIGLHEPLGLVRGEDDFGLKHLTSLQGELARDALHAHRAEHGVRGDEYVREGREQASNVVVIVLESINARRWNDPEIAPEFASWKSQGTYFPRAIAHYPATPLAYGSMFLSQTPYVLIHSPYWAKSTPLKYLKERGVFDSFYLSRPDNHWFKQSTITSFLLGSQTSSNVHESTSSGLSGLRQHLERTHRNAGERTFSWLHVYDAHTPYKFHSHVRPRKKGESRKLASYLSELSYVDQQLSAFMTWYFDHPVHENTLLVVLADHGEGIGEEVMGKPFWGHHVHVHRDVSHIPMFLAGPGIARQRQIEQSVAGQIDLIPTIFDAIGEALPESFMAQGQSLYPVIGEHVPEQDWISPEERILSTEAFSIRGQKFFDFVANTTKEERRLAEGKPLQELAMEKNGYSPKVSIQKGAYKLVYNRSSHRFALHDVEEDSSEKIDVSARQPLELERLIDTLNGWRNRQQVIIEQLERTPNTEPP